MISFHCVLKQESLIKYKALPNGINAGIISLSMKHKSISVHASSSKVSKRKKKSIPKASNHPPRVSAKSQSHNTATTPAIAKATMPPNACWVGAAAAELATLAALADAPALPVGVEAPLEALVVSEPEDIALDDAEGLDDTDPVDEMREDTEEERDEAEDG